MNHLTRIAIALAALSIVAPVASHEKHGHESFSAGEPGDPNKPSRTVEVLLNEMDFTPARIEVKRGEQIRFVLRNAGTEDHEFLLATTAENLKHAELMKKHPHMEHDDPNGVRLELTVRTKDDEHMGEAAKHAHEKLAVWTRQKAERLGATGGKAVRA